MKRTIMILTAIVLLLVIGLANAKDYEITKKSGDYTIQIKMDKNPPITGENKIDITIKDITGKNVIDAAVGINYGMPAMPGMGAMNYKTTAGLKGESYLATINFSMAGPSFINIKITRAGKSQLVKLNVDVK